MNTVKLNHGVSKWREANPMRQSIGMMTEDARMDIDLSKELDGAADANEC